MGKNKKKDKGERAKKDTKSKKSKAPRVQKPQKPQKSKAKDSSKKKGKDTKKAKYGKKSRRLTTAEQVPKDIHGYARKLKKFEILRGDKWKKSHPHLFKQVKKDHGIGRAIQPKRDLTRFVKWPRYVRIQRQRAILLRRLKVPPAINIFTKVLDKNQASELFTFLAKYRPETKLDKKRRLQKLAASEVKGKKVPKGSKKDKFIKFGMNTVVSLVEQKKAKLVCIAHDVDPIELIVWMPALCRKMGVPYCIVKSKSRLGQICRRRKVTCLAITDVHRDDQFRLENFAQSFMMTFNDSYPADMRKWGGGILGKKAMDKIRKAAREKAREDKALRR